MWIGESEKNLSLAFEKARGNRPAVLFFDELDALAYSRSKASSDHTRNLVNELLGQLDGVENDKDQVLVLAATNLPWDVDAAMKRPGRFDRGLFVPPPDTAARAEMLRQKLVGVPLGAVDLSAVAKATDYCSGADMDGLVEAAKENVLEDILTTGRERPLEQSDLLGAAQTTEASTTDWLRTARNLVKYAGGDRSYKEVERYLKRARFTG